MHEPMWWAGMISSKFFFNYLVAYDDFILFKPRLLQLAAILKKILSHLHSFVFDKHYHTCTLFFPADSSLEVVHFPIPSR